MLICTYYSTKKRGPVVEIPRRENSPRDDDPAVADLNAAADDDVGANGTSHAPGSKHERSGQSPRLHDRGSRRKRDTFQPSSGLFSAFSRICSGLDSDSDPDAAVDQI